MADYTKIYGIDQIESGTIDRDKLKVGLLEGSDLNLTNGSNNATITGLRAGTNANDVVIKSQLDALSAMIGSPMRYKGQLDASIPNPDLDAIDNYVGDTYFISVSGTFLGVEFTVGDMLIVNKDVPSGTTITSADFDKIDNTEASDILRIGDIIDNLTSTGVVDQPLSANQGYVLKSQLDALSALVKLREYDVELTHTVGSVTLTIPHLPVSGTVRLYKRGMRLTHVRDYTISGSTITLATQAKTNDIYTVDYER